jgi:hypothetical protein
VKIQSDHQLCHGRTWSFIVPEVILHISPRFELVSSALSQHAAAREIFLPYVLAMVSVPGFPALSRRCPGFLFGIVFGMLAFRLQASGVVSKQRITPVFFLEWVAWLFLQFQTKTYKSY